jgi:hypothetical protein
VPCVDDFVVGLTLVLVHGVLVALLGGMLPLWSVRRAWIECLVATIRRSLVILFLFVLVVVAMMTAVIAILPLVVVVVILVALPAAATVTPLTLFCDTADLLVVSLMELVTHLASHVMLDMIRRSLIVLFLFALVIVATMTTVIPILPHVVVAVILVALPAVATVTPLTLFRDTADLLLVLLTELVTHLASHVMLNLTLAFLC